MVSHELRATGFEQPMMQGKRHRVISGRNILAAEFQTDTYERPVSSDDQEL